MPLSKEQQECIALVDEKVKYIVESGGNEKEMLVSLIDQMPIIRTIVQTPDKVELDMYCQTYDGFHRYMKVLETLARRIANDDIAVPG